LNIDEAFADGISLIEWPERLGSLLPRNHLELDLSYGTTEFQRRAVISAGYNWYRRLQEIP
jgi:tRNA threonylcarbamoyladenosine biosynthesis protein TsaE